MNIFGDSALDSFVLSVRPETALTPRKVRLPLTTIDKLVAELNLPRIDFIKMDIEGAERNALRGAAETLRRFRPRLGLALENLPDDPVILPNLIKSLQPGYQFLPGPCEGWDFVAPTSATSSRLPNDSGSTLSTCSSINPLTLPSSSAASSSAPF